MAAPATSTHGRAVAGGIGAIAFSVSSLMMIFIGNPPGGGFEQAAVTSFLGTGHRVVVIVLFHLAMLGVMGLLVFLGELRARVGEVGGRASSLLNGLGGAAAACFAIGWGVVCGQALAHAEGGPQVVVSSSTTYLVSQVGVTFVFGCGAALLGLAMLTAAATALEMARPLKATLVTAGVAGFAGLAWITFFVMLVLVGATGVALLTRTERLSMAAEPATA
jgi:hypothetical protein